MDMCNQPLYLAPELGKTLSNGVLKLSWYFGRLKEPENYIRGFQYKDERGRIGPA